MHDVTTIGDAMRDIFIFPSLEEMEKPLTDEQIESGNFGVSKASFKKYLVFGLGDKVTISDVDFSIGGTAANVAAGLAKIGLKTAIISALGDDNAGVEILKRLKDAKVSAENIKIYKNRHSSFSVIVSYKGERTIFVYHAFKPVDFSIPNDIKSQWVYLGPMAEGYERTYNKIVSLVIKKNLKVAVNPGSVQIKAGLGNFGGLKGLIEIIFLNREEAQKLSGLPGHPTVKDIAKVIHLEGPKTVIITDGKAGAYAYNGDDFMSVGPYPAKKLDATGAGDAFAAGFLASHILEQGLQESLKWGVTNSASVVEEIGAQEGLLGRSSLKRRVKEYRWPAEGLRFS